MLSDQSKEKARYWARRLEVPVDKDAEYRNTYWCNRDLIPIPPDRRTVIAGVNTTAWTFGSSLLSLGLSASQSLGVMAGVALVTALIAVLCGWPGSHQHLGFTVLSRASWGMRGSFWPVLNRIVTAIIWLGIQMYWGGQSVKIILGSLVGTKWVHLKNTIPASANVDTASLASFMIFLVIFLPCLMIPPERLQKPFIVTFAMITCTMFGILGWAIATAGGAGTLLHTPATKSGSALSWSAIYGLQSIVGSSASGCLGQSDWTRYAKTTNAALFGQIITAPLTIFVTGVCGIFITSATAEIYGKYVWNPFELLIFIQQQQPLTAAARAGTFFAGLGFLCSQIALCIVLNCVSAGMDLAALCPKWINIRRGTYFLSFIAVAICPWNYVTKPTTFITVLSGWSVFLSPMTGIVVSDYFLVRGRGYHQGDLYLGNSDSAYWYYHGFNWRGFTAWIVGTFPTLPGFARTIQGVSDGSGWDHIYQITYLYGFCSAAVVYWAAHTIFPTPRQTGRSPFILREHAENVSDRSDQGDVEEVEVHSEKCDA